MEIVGIIILVIAIATSDIVLSSDDIEEEASLFWCFGMCLKLEQNLSTESDPNNPDEEMKDEIRNGVRDDIMGKRCGSAADPMC
jgi:hypothetical protein